MTWIYLSLALLCCLGLSNSKPNGAPSDSCFYMTPRHIHPHTYRKVFPTRAMGLYNITTSADIFRPDRPIRVTLWGPPFKGFMMVAAEEGAKDWPTGIFYSDDGSAKRLSCLGRGDTVTHQNNSYKDSVSVLWYGPENMMSEQIQFIATVVVNLTIYYTNIKSGFLRLDPTLHASQAGGENGPVVVTMDPWLAGNSATRPPVNWWNRGSGGGLLGSLGSLFGGSSSGSSWGSGSSGSGSSWNSGRGRGSNTWSSGSDWQQWGDGSVTSRSTWSDTSGGSSWGSSGNRWGGSSSGSGQGSWGSSSGSSWDSQSGSSWGQSPQGESSWGSSGSSGNSWGSSSGSSGSSGSGGAGDQSAGGSSIWTWNSGPSTQAPSPKTTKAPPTPAPASAGTGSSAWSVDTLINLLKELLARGPSSASTAT